MLHETDSANNILELSDYRVGFRTERGLAKAVDGVSLSLKRGSTLAIVGESGSGKSVTSLSAMRLVPSPPGRISSGEIIFHKNESTSVNLLSLSEESMRSYRGNDLAMIFQEPMTSLNPVFTCGNQVVEAIMLHQKLNSKEAKDLAIDLFKKVELPDPERIFNTNPHQISGGQKQRINLARALAASPEVLLCDEVISALDSIVGANVIELLKRLRKKTGVSFVFISHDLSTVASFADEIVVLYAGRVVEQGHVDQVLSPPYHPYTRCLLYTSPSPRDVEESRMPSSA